MKRVVLTLMVCAFAAAARAADTDTRECQWFPDLRCDRHGRFEGFVAPVSMPFYFEDPFITTGLYTWGLWHNTPQTSAFDGGNAYLVAVQARLALTDTVGLIATEDGYSWVYPGSDSLIRQGSGWMNYMFGLKWAAWQSKEKDAIVSLSLRYKTTWGTAGIFQQGGKGGVVPTLSFAWGRDRFHAIGDAGGYIAIDGAQESTFAFFNAHLDYQVLKILYPFVELNGIVYTDDGDGSREIKLNGGVSIPLSTAQAALRTGAFDGVDYANLGSSGVNGQFYMTGAVGVRCRLNGWSTIGIAYERPLTNDHEITKQRATLSLDFEL